MVETLVDDGAGAGWQRRVVDRSLDDAKKRSIDRGARLIRAAAKVLDRTHGESLTVQEVADEAGQSLRTLYQYFASKDDLLLAVYEEAMRTYAQLITAAVDRLEDPLERLAGGIIAAARMPSMHAQGRDRGLAHLRLQLSQAHPTLVASAQEPVTLSSVASSRKRPATASCPASTAMPRSSGRRTSSPRCATRTTRR